MSATAQIVGTVDGMDTTLTLTETTFDDDEHGWIEVPSDSAGPGQSVALGDGKTVVTVRESNMFDLLAFATMIRQILEPLAGVVPGVDTVLRLTGGNAEVMRNDETGQRLRMQLGARPLFQNNRPYGWVFEVEGTIFLFAMTSAFGDTAEDLTNNFTDDLIDLLKSHRPAALVSGPSTRLVRRKDLGERLGRQAGLLGVRIFTKETPEGIDLNTPTGSTQWTLLGLLAESDLRQTLTRLLTGRIFHVRSGGWLAGEGALPLGYRLKSKDDKRPVVGNCTQVEQARLLIHLAAKAGNELHLPEDRRTLTPESIIALLSDAGVKKRSNKKKSKRGAPIAGTPLDTVTDPKLTLTNLLSLLPAYMPDGMVTRMQGLSMTGLSRHDVHGEAIYKKDPNDIDEKGAIRFTWHFPKPVNDDGDEEPWATDEELASAQRYLQHLRDSGETRLPTTQQWPLSGLFTADRNGQRYRLSHGSSGYQWKCDGAAVGKFDAKEAVSRMVDAIITSLDELRIDPNDVSIGQRRTSTISADGEVRTLEQKRDRLDRDLVSACAAVRDAKEGSRQRQIHQTVVDDLEAQLDELNRQLESASTAAVSAEPEDLRVGDLATLLSVLADTAGDQVPPEVCDQLRRMVISATVNDCWDDASPWGTFKGTIAVPTDQGFMRPVDFSFELGNTSQGPDRKAFPKRRMPRVLEMRMTTDITIDELASRLGAEPTPLTVGRNLQRVLRPYFERQGLSKTAASKATSAILDCPILSTRSIIWALLTDQPTPETIEDLTPDETARHIEDLKETYLSPRFDWKVSAWSSGGEAFRREAVRWVAAQTSSEAPDAGVRAVELMTVAGLHELQHLRALQWHGSASADGKARVLERTEPWPGPRDIDPATGKYATPVPDGEKRLKLRECPHCGHRGLHPLACVEFGEDPVICPECRRHPGDPTLRRPSSYLANWEGAWGHSRADKQREKGTERTGTVLGPPPAMLSLTRSRRARRHKDTST